MTGRDAPRETNRGRFIFTALVLVVVLLALLAFAITGPKGIEERFASALGLPSGDDHEEGDASPGLPIEGHPALYALVIAGLCGGCWFAYRRFGM